jgi:hypothetical protein
MIEVTGKSLSGSATPGQPSPVSARALQNVYARRVDCLEPRPPAEDPRERHHLGVALRAGGRQPQPVPKPGHQRTSPPAASGTSKGRCKEAGASRRRWYATLGSPLSGLFQAEVIAIDLGLAV